MSYSDLTTYVNTTDKCGSRSGYEITRITPHEMAARWTGQQCADYFCSTDRECSSNYCIGYDGSIACNVEEEYRAWTSSSWDNDCRAITVEISNDDLDAYDMSDEAIEAFIELCVDLFQRYPSLGGKAVYTGDTDGNITLHRWFSSTSCPGDWFVSQIEWIVEEINNRLEHGGSDMQQNEWIVENGYIMDGSTYATVGNCIYWAERNAERANANSADAVAYAKKANTNASNCLTRIKSVEEKLDNLQIGGATVDYDKIATVVADKLYARLKA